MTQSLPPQPELGVLAALAHPERYEIVSRLLGGVAMTQKQIGLKLGLPSGIVSRHMATLERAGIVTRRTVHGPYEVQFPTEVRRLLMASADLAVSFTKQQTEAASLEAMLLRRSMMEE